MKQNKIISLGAVAVALAAVVGIAAASMAASDNQNQAAAIGCHNGSKRFGLEFTEAQKQEMEAKRQSIDSALAANDYSAWLNAVGSDSAQAKIITADKFSQLVQAHQLEQEAKSKLDQARQIREQLGLKGAGQGNGLGQGKGLGKCPGRCPLAPADTN